MDILAVENVPVHPENTHALLVAHLAGIVPPLLVVAVLLLLVVLTRDE